MLIRFKIWQAWSLLLVVPAMLSAVPHAWGQAVRDAQPRRPSAYRVAERTDARVNAASSAVNIPGPEAAAPANVAVADPLLPLPGEHPMMPALRWAKTGLEDLRQVSDYSATMVKRERIDGVLGEHQYIFCKVRHAPFSVYLHFLSPTGIKGQEVIYVDGQNDNQLKAHTVGLRDSIVGTISLDPKGRIAMKGQRYPIMETGILNLTEKLVEVGQHDTQYGECTYKAFKGAKVNGRICTCLQFIHPVPRKEFRFHLARIFVDEELNLPIRYEAYEWPTEKDGKPQLSEEYTYINLKLNNGFTDLDFDTRNPQYKFR
ncbi:MAG: DUF1571 domain-containing protein [Pirellulales bacterium]